MKAPKILPWVAKKAGISEELALKLWRRALGEAEQLTHTVDGSEYWSLVHDRFQSLVEDETRVAYADRLVPAPRLTWLTRHQTRMSLLSLEATENAYRLWQNAWQSIYAPKKAA